MTSTTMRIRAEAGGIDAAVWAGMLQRMYGKWAERNLYSFEVLDSTPGPDGGGLKYAAVQIGCPPGMLRSEIGTHRLVRISPFDSQGRRQTSFAGVEIEGQWPLAINTPNTAWGSQIRSYIMAPYTLVKDLRTEVETDDVLGVLDGAIELFLAEDGTT